MRSRREASGREPGFAIASDSMISHLCPSPFCGASQASSSPLLIRPTDFLARKPSEASDRGEAGGAPPLSSPPAPPPAPPAPHAGGAGARPPPPPLLSPPPPPQKKKPAESENRHPPPLRR